MKTVNEVAKLCGISVRTLHYYDGIGLLSPAETTAAGYRLYDDRAIARLQQILFFRELDFPLREIRAILDNPSFDPQEALRAQQNLLIMKRNRLDGLIGLVDVLLKGERTMSLNEFDNTEIEAAQKQYAEEARARWGGSAAYRESEEKTAAYGKEEWAAIEAGQKELFQRFAGLLDQDPAGEAAQALTAEWQSFITAHFYSCTKEILAGLGEMYTADERFSRNLNQYGDGLAQFMSKAIAEYCK